MEVEVSRDGNRFNSVASFEKNGEINVPLSLHIPGN